VHCRRLLSQGQNYERTGQLFAAACTFNWSRRRTVAIAGLFGAVVANTWKYDYFAGFSAQGVPSRTRCGARFEAQDICHGAMPFGLADRDLVDAFS